MIQSRKVVILGAGHVGTHCALSLMFRQEADEIVLIDQDREKAFAQALDLNDGTACIDSGVIIRSGDYGDCKDADILVVAIGRGRKPGETRLQLFADSIERAKEIAPRIKESGFAGIMISITNPADVVGEYLRRQIGLPRSRSFSTGTSLDSLRLRRVLSEKTGYDRNSIQAFCMGEHGDSQMVPFSHVRVGGKSFLKLREERPDTLGRISLEEIEEEARQAGMVIIEGKKSTEFGIGIALCEIVSAIFRDKKKIWPVSVALEGEYGQTRVAAGVPVVLGRNGVEEIIQLALTEEEKKKFDRSCDIIRDYLAKAETM